MGIALKTQAVYEAICDNCQKTVDSENGALPPGWESWSRNAAHATVAATLCDACGPKAATATRAAVLVNLPEPPPPEEAPQP